MPKKKSAEKSPRKALGGRLGKKPGKPRGRLGKGIAGRIQKPDFGKLARMLSPQRRMDAKVRDSAGTKGNEFALLLIAEPKDYANLPPALARLFSDMGETGIYITANKPFVNLRKELDSAGITHERFRFIDVVSSMMGSGMVQARNVDYLDSPSDLTEIMVLIEKRLASLSEKRKFLVLDSVSAMIIYNDTDSVEKFVHALIGKIHEFGVQGVLLMVSSEQYRGTMQIIGQFCDHVENL